MSRALLRKALRQAAQAATKTPLGRRLGPRVGACECSRACGYARRLLMAIAALIYQLAWVLGDVACLFGIVDVEAHVVLLIGRAW